MAKTAKKTTKKVAKKAAKTAPKKVARKPKTEEVEETAIERAKRIKAEKAAKEAEETEEVEEDEETEEDEDEKEAPKKKAAKKGGKLKPGKDPSKTYEAMKDLFILMDEDIEKFLVDEVKSSARKLRVNAQSVKKLIGIFRKEIMDLVKARKG